MAKRELTFTQLNHAVSELDRLLENGYTSAGKWNLAQAATHLDLWMTYPMDGFPALGVMAPMMWIIKVTMGQSMLKSILEDGFKTGTPTNPATVPDSDVSTDEFAVDKLKQTIARFETFEGQLHASPIFGNLDKTTALQLQLRHLEHHLSFLVPNQD